MHYKRTEKAYNIHAGEALRCKATIHNLGWGSNAVGNWISIASKTDKGILQTTIDFDCTPISVEHTWRK